jgi:hypothetical protein
MARIADENNFPNRDEHHFVRSEITWMLTFVSPADEVFYLASLKNLFYFPTFVPVIFLFIIFVAGQNSIVTKVAGGDSFLIISFAFNVFCLILIVLFTIMRFIDYFHQYMSGTAIAISDYFLRRFLRGNMEDLILICGTIAQGFYTLSLISRDLCVGCANVFAVQECIAEQAKHFPLVQGIIGYLGIILLDIYFKSIHRHIVLLSWAILTGFIIAAFIFADYVFEFNTLLLIVFFCVSIYEFERYKMIAFLLSKEALSNEKNKFKLANEKANIIQRKLHMALVHQILPPKVAEQIINGQVVAPEEFEEVTIFFSDVEGFTTICSQVSPVKVVRMLNNLYTVMDYCTSLFPVYKVETIGDAYMVSALSISHF